MLHKLSALSSAMEEHIIVEQDRASKLFFNLAHAEPLVREWVDESHLQPGHGGVEIAHHEILTQILFFFIYARLVNFYSH